MVQLVSVAALSDNLVIGKDGDIPWESIPADKQQYRNRIEDDPVILGRVTFEMFEELPGSLQIVMSRSEQSFDVDTAIHASTVEEAVELAEQHGAETAYVIGGGGIYDLFQPHLDRMVLSRVPGEYDGDSFYPEWDETEWTVVETTEYDQFTLEEWERTAPA